MKQEDEGYDRFPDRYIDAIAEDVRDNYFVPVLNEVLDSIPLPKTVCDVGCGNGVFTIGLKQQHGCELIGVDGSEHAVQMAHQIGFDTVHQIGDFCREPLPVADGQADLVICKDVLEHLLEPEYLVAELARATKPGGHCLIHVPNHFPLIGRIKFLFTNNIDTFNYFPDAKRWDFPHIRFFDKQSLLELAGLHGLDPALDASWNFFRPARVTKAMPWLAKMFGNRFSDATSEGVTVLFSKPA